MCVCVLLSRARSFSHWLDAAAGVLVRSALVQVLSYTFVACLAIVYVDFRGWIIKL